MALVTAALRSGVTLSCKQADPSVGGMADADIASLANCSDESKSANRGHCLLKYVFA